MNRSMKKEVCEDLWALMERRTENRVTPTLWLEILNQLDDRLWSRVDLPIAEGVMGKINEGVFPDDTE